VDPGASAKPRDVVVMAPQPASRLWTAVSLAVGGSVLAAALLLALSELFMGFEPLLVEAIARSH
jgi:hypothetical protein